MRNVCFLLVCNGLNYFLVLHFVGCGCPCVGACFLNPLFHLMLVLGRIGPGWYSCIDVLKMSLRIFWYM